MGVMSGTLDLMQRSYAGTTVRDGALLFEPRLLDRLDGAAFSMQFRGMPLAVEILGDTLTVLADPEGASHPVRVGVAAQIQVSRLVAARILPAGSTTPPATFGPPISTPTVMFAPNLAWREEPLRAAIEATVHLPTVVENDVNAAAWAEARFGAGRGEEYVVVITVGTGIGGGLVVDGNLVRGRFGVAAEIGHINIVPDGRRCGCGLQGCWEQYASGRVLVQEAYELANASPAMAKDLLALAGGRPGMITGPMITEAAKAGDVAALQCFDEIGRWLGRGIAQLAAILDPGAFVIGGGVSSAGDILREPTLHSYRKHLTARGHRPLADIRIAELGAEAGIVGAADLARCAR